jgi:hypothetical protein
MLKKGLMGVESRYGPEGIIDKSIEQLGRQQGRSFYPFDLAADRMKIGCAERDIELVSFEFDIIEIVGETIFRPKIRKAVSACPRVFSPMLRSRPE